MSDVPTFTNFIPRPRIFYGWYIVFTAAAIIFFTGGTFFYGFGAIFDRLLAEFGWSRASISLGFSLRAEAGGLAAPLVGLLVDRFGPRKVMSGGVVLVGVGFVTMSLIQNLWQFYAVMVFIAVGMSATGGPVGMVAVSNWFDRRRGRAMAFMTVGAGLSGIMVPLLEALISAFGWREALVILALLMWGIGLPLGQLMRGHPEHYGMLPDGVLPDERGSQPVRDGQKLKAHADLLGMTMREALRSRVFWVLTIATTVSFLGSNSVIVHQIPYLTHAGYSSQTAAWLVTLLTFTSLAGRLGLGWLADFLDKRHVLVVAFILQAAGIVIFSTIGAWWQIALFLLLFAPGFGGSIPVRPAIQAEYFGRRSFGAIVGVTVAITSLGTVIGPPFVGWVFDTWGTYQPGFLVLAALTVVSAVMILSLPRPQVRTRTAISETGH